MRALRVLAGAGVSVVLAAGCTGGSGAAPSASTSASASVSTLPSPSVTPSATASVPAAARAHTKAGAEAFVRFYMDQVNLAWTGPNQSVLPGLGIDGCLSCSSFQDIAVALVKEGHRYAHDPVTVLAVVAETTLSGVQQRLTMTLHQHEVDVIDATGATVSTDPDKTGDFTVVVTWKGGRWLLYDMG
jgi:hypothetical protein